MTGFLIEALFISNLFVFLYNNLLRFLNLSFAPPKPAEFIRVGAVPEPFEISLYLLLSVLGVLFLWLLHRHHKNPSSQQFRHPMVKYLFLGFLTLLFIVNLGMYPMARSAYPYLTPASSLTYHLFFLVYIAISVFFLLEAALIQRVLEKKKNLFPFVFTFIIALIALVVFEPRFPIVGHDYSYFLGPIWEVAHGKTLYTDVPSQYGFASILFFAFLYRFHFIDVVYFPVFVWFFYILEYSLGFYLIYKVSKNLVISLLGLFSIISLNYFSLYHLPASIPQTGPMRWLPLFLSLFFLYKFKDITSKKLLFVISLLSFWVLDSGISLILAYLFTLFIIFLKKNVTFYKVIKTSLTLFAFLILNFITINGINLLLGYRFINIVVVFRTFQEYAKAGFGMIPIDPYTYFWVVPLTYFATIIYFFRNSKQVIPNNQVSRNKQYSNSKLFNTLERWIWDLFGNWKLEIGNSEKVLLFSANLSLFASVYFVGRSHPHNLFHISLFPIFNAFLLFGLILKNNFSTERSRPFPTFIFYLLSFILFIVYPIYNRQEVMTLMLKDKMEKFQQGNILIPEWIDNLHKKYAREIQLIKNSLPERQILILSADDTYLFYLTGKQNLLNDNSQITILTKKDVDLSLKKVFATCPSSIVADCTLFASCKTSHPFTIIASFSIQPILLKRSEEVCRIHYTPTQCTNELCLAVSNKIK